MLLFAVCFLLQLALLVVSHHARGQQLLSALFPLFFFVVTLARVRRRQTGIIPGKLISLNLNSGEEGEVVP